MKIIIKLTIIVSIFLVSCSQIQRPKNGNFIYFSNYKWEITQSDEQIGPGDNFFTNSNKNIFIDKDKRLHLKINRRIFKWNCSQLKSVENFGYGTYVIQLETDFTDFSPNAVFGFFLYDEDNPEFAHREIDLEIAQWADKNKPIGNYVIQDGNLKRDFDYRLKDRAVTHFIHYTPEFIEFKTIYGHSLDYKTENYVITEWKVDKEIPEGSQNLYMNLWLYENRAPNNAVEVIIKKVKFFPLED